MEVNGYRILAFFQLSFVLSRIQTGQKLGTDIWNKSSMNKRIVVGKLSL